MTDATARFDLPLILPAQAQKHLTHNEALRVLDLFMHLSVVDDTTATPPTTAAENDAYIIPDQATDDWSGRAGQIAIWIDGLWQYFLPVTGCLAWITAHNTLVLYNGTTWGRIIPDMPAAGQDGSDGASAYDIAKQHGFDGSEAEWLASLRGSDGQDGQDGATTWTDLSDKPALYSYFPVWAEENGDLNNGSTEWAFGNGNDTPNGMGLVFAFDCDLIGLSLCTEETASCTVEALKNGVSTAKSVTLANAAKGVENFEQDPVSFQAGDTINFHTISGDAASNGGLVTAWFRRVIV